MKIPLLTVCVVVLFMATDSPAQVCKPAEGPSRGEILALLNHNDSFRSRESLIKIGESAVPVLLEVAKAPETEDWQRARIFSVVRALPDCKKDKFIELAAEHLPKSSRFANQALALLEYSKSSKHASAVCDYLFRTINEDLEEKTDVTKPVLKAISVIGTRDELDRVNNWLKENKERLGPSDRVWKKVNKASKDLHAKLSS